MDCDHPWNRKEMYHTKTRLFLWENGWISIVISTILVYNGSFPMFRRWLSTILVYNVIFNYLMFRCHCFKELPIPQTNAANAAPQPPASSTLCTHDSPRNTRRVLSCRFATTQTEHPPRKKTQKKMPVRDRSIQQMMVCFFDRFVDWLSCNPHTPSCDPVTISPVGRVATATAWAP